MSRSAWLSRQKHLNKPSGLFVVVGPPCSSGFPPISTCSYRYLRLWETISKSLDRLWEIELIWRRHLSFKRRVKARKSQKYANSNRGTKHLKRYKLRKPKTAWCSHFGKHLRNQTVYALSPLMT